MAVEIEAKMKVADLAPVRERVEAAGAKLIGDFIEHNLYFDTDDRSLLAADEGLRLRQTTDRNTGVATNMITFKGPRKHGKLKSREETEVNVSDFTAAATLLENMGFTRVLSFEKRRESWFLSGCRIELDELPHLGTYVEIEGSRDDAVIKLREALHLTDRPLVRASYIALMMTYLQERGDSRREVVFEK